MCLDLLICKLGIIRGSPLQNTLVGIQQNNIEKERGLKGGLKQHYVDIIHSINVNHDSLPIPPSFKCNLGNFSGPLLPFWSTGPRTP